MPEISRFFGIVVSMYWNDHNPPHFHAAYGDREAVIGLDGEVLQGSLPRRALSMALEWLAIHRAELLADWELARLRKPLKPIDPLE
jgi:hypothetical protein